jgi:glycosyltransferase involved in cell wall biosynthesis
VRILYDGRVYSFQAFGGINRYFANIIRRLPDNCRPHIIAPSPARHNLPLHPNLRVLPYGRVRLKHISWRLGALAETLERKYIERLSLSQHFDVVHPTYYDLLTRCDIRDYRVPVVLTVHDMIHDLFPTLTINSSSEIDMKRRAVAAAQAIICVSESTKNDLITLYSVPEDKITVIPNASGIDDTLAHGSEPVPDRPYFLYVGSRTAYKNFDGLLRAFATAFECVPDVMLSVVGKSFSQDETRLINKLHLSPRIEHYSEVDDCHLAKLYRCSIALVYPSFYEGFGIPPLEAMSCGTAVIAARSSSIPEVVGDAALLVDPRSVDDLGVAMERLFHSPSERQVLITKGQARARMFSWERTATKTFDVYRSVAHFQSPTSQLPFQLKTATPPSQYSDKMTVTSILSALSSE